MNPTPSATVRTPAVAGLFYPGASAELTRNLAELLGAVAPDAPGRAVPKALIAPHAGYIYSGPIAASAYALLAPARHRIRRVVLLGPTHRVAVRGLALPGCEAFATPLGNVPIDAQAVESLRRLPQVGVSAPAHAQEHSLEVHVPFLQTVLERFTLVPLAVGRAAAHEVAEVLDLLWGGPETLIVVSSDLSHYLPYPDAQALDHATARSILAFATDLTHEQACGATPVTGLNEVARRRGLKPELIDLRNSGDTAGDRNRVVGYGSFAYYETAPARRAASDAGSASIPSRSGRVTLSSGGPPASPPGHPADAGEILLKLARAAIVTELGLPRDGAPASPSWLERHGASFVTLKLAGKLRGCIGTLRAHRALGEDLKHNALGAAFRDPRFKPLTAPEYAGIAVEVSVLSALEPMQFVAEADALAQLRPGVDGIVFEYGTHSSTFLPQVWADIREPADFLSHLKYKAGLPPDFWDPAVRLSRYTVQKWHETPR
jgi:AmmeMemoRadiSam system protein B/AmmeMemoRadiSam system protein A